MHDAVPADLLAAVERRVTEVLADPERTTERKSRTEVHWGTDYHPSRKETRPNQWPVSGDPVIAALAAISEEFTGLAPVSAILNSYDPAVNFAKAGPSLPMHRDADAYGEVVTGFSFGSTVPMRLRRSAEGGGFEGPTISVPLPVGSMLVLSGEARWDWGHAIQAVKQRRSSITFRTQPV